MRAKLLIIPVLMMILLSSCVQGFLTDQDRSLLSQRIGFTTPNKEYRVIQYLDQLDCFDYEPQCSVLGDEWSTAISQNGDETHLIDTALNFVIGQRKGYSVCAKEIRNGVPREIIISGRILRDNVFGELCEKDLFPQRIGFLSNVDPSKFYSVLRHNFPFNCIERISECPDLGDEWSLATFLNIADTQPIKSAVRMIVGNGPGFSICAKIIGNGAPYPGFISDLRGQADHEVIYGELCVKDTD